MRTRIIDILVKIANGENPPKKIRYNALFPKYSVLVYDEDEQEYRFENDNAIFWKVPNHHLKDEVEILE